MAGCENSLRDDRISPQSSGCWDAFRRPPHRPGAHTRIAPAHRSAGREIAHIHSPHADKDPATLAECIGLDAPCGGEPAEKSEMRTKKKMRLLANHLPVARLMALPEILVQQQVAIMRPVTKVINDKDMTAVTGGWHAPSPRRSHNGRQRTSQNRFHHRHRVSGRRPWPGQPPASRHTGRGLGLHWQVFLSSPPGSMINSNLLAVISAPRCPWRSRHTKVHFAPCPADFCKHKAARHMTGTNLHRRICPERIFKSPGPPS